MYAIRSYYDQREHEALNQHAIVSVSNAAGHIIYINDLVITSYSIHYTKLYDH